MQNAPGQPMARRFAQIKKSGTAQMPMNYAIFRMIIEQLFQLAQILRKIEIIHQRKMIYPSAQTFDFIFERTSAFMMHQKIKLYCRSIHPAVHIHDEAFHAADIHYRNNMQDSDHLRNTFL